MADTVKTKQAERRKHERFQIASAVLKCAKAGFISLLNKPFQAELVNLSAGGMRVKTTATVKVGEDVTGKVTIQENGDTVDFAARVVWAYVVPPAYRGDPALTIAGFLFKTGDISRDAKIDAMRKWFQSNRYKTTRRLA